MRPWTRRASVRTGVASRRRVNRLGRPLLLVVAVAMLAVLGGPTDLARSAPARAGEPHAFLDAFTGGRRRRRPGTGPAGT